MKTSPLIYEVNDRPPLWLALIMAIQHVMLIYGEDLPLIIATVSDKFPAVKSGTVSRHRAETQCW